MPPGQFQAGSTRRSHRFRGHQPVDVVFGQGDPPPGRDTDPDALIFTGPGGGNGVPAGTRTILSRHGFRRLYQNAVRRAGVDLADLQLRGPHDLRHTFSTWLEDAGVPARVIDELMGHQRSHRGESDGGSRIGVLYRHTTPEMDVRVIKALEVRLTVVLQVADGITYNDGQWRSIDVF